MRPARRVGPDGQQIAELVVEITQSRMGYRSPEIQQKADALPAGEQPPADFKFRGGCTLLIDMTHRRGALRDQQGHSERPAAWSGSASSCSTSDGSSLRATYFADRQWRRAVRASPPAALRSKPMARRSRARAAAAPAGDARDNHPSGRQPVVSRAHVPAGARRLFPADVPATQGRPFHMLIDCGVLLGTEDQDEQMRQVVAATSRETTGGRIDVLVATHEHWDHLSGFVQAGSVFDRSRSARSGSPGPRTRMTSWPTSCAGAVSGAQGADVRALRLQAAAGRSGGRAGGGGPAGGERSGGVLEFSGAAGRGRRARRSATRSTTCAAR